MSNDFGLGLWTTLIKNLRQPNSKRKGRTQTHRWKQVKSQNKEGVLKTDVTESQKALISKVKQRKGC